MEQIKEQILQDLEILTFFKEEIDKISSFSKDEKLMILKSYSTILFSSRDKVASPRNNEQMDIPSPLASKSSQSKTLAELVRLTKVKQHPDIVMLAVYHLIIAKQADSATVTDIEQQYSNAMIKPSSNTSVMVNLNRRKGYLMEADKKDGKMAFKITMSGVDYVESMIAGAQ